MVLIGRGRLRMYYTVSSTAGRSGAEADTYVPAWLRKAEERWAGQWQRAWSQSGVVRGENRVFNDFAQVVQAIMTHVPQR